MSLPGHGGGQPWPVGHPPDKDVTGEFGDGVALPTQNTQPTPGQPIPGQLNSTRIKRKTKAHIKLASLNMNGRASAGQGTNSLSKWKEIPHLLEEHQIAILAIQETHLNNNDMLTLERQYGKKIVIYNSSDPLRPHASAGVAFVLNRKIANIHNLVITEVIPGRVIHIQTKWHGIEEMSIINIYNYNDPTKQTALYMDVLRKMNELHIPKPDFIMGDFNTVEDALDRSPPREEPTNVQEAFREVRHSLKMRDCWRETYPTKRAFTFSSSGNSLSRIDRIYTTEKHLPNIYKCEITKCRVPTDHSLVSIHFTCAEAPYVGKGRYTIPLYLISNEKLLNKIIIAGKQFITNTEQSERTDTCNPQIEWEEMKNNITLSFREYARQDTPKLKHKIRSLTRDIEQASKDPGLDESEEARWRISLLRSEIDHLHAKRAKTAHQIAQARWHTQGEKIGRYWSKCNQEAKPRDLMQRLQCAGKTPPVYETKTEEMAEIARNFHEDLQKRNDNPRTPEERDQHTNQVLQIIDKSRKLTPEQKETLSGVVSEDDV